MCYTLLFRYGSFYRSHQSRIKQREDKYLGLPENELVISYLGSIGAWYMLDEMLEFFSVIKEKYTGAKFLFITHSYRALFYQKLEKYKLEIRIL